MSENIKVARETLKDTLSRNSVNEEEVHKKRKIAIQNVVQLIDIEDKSEVYHLVKYVLDHSRFYTNPDDIENLKRNVLLSRTFSSKMKTAVHNQGVLNHNQDACYFNDDDEHLMIGNQTYDYEDDYD